ncbi:MAG: hypothetical protein OXC60_00280 [Litoreibacter sp.]|nr:hypothetical protein [Litoreibacter sp.]
MPQADLLYSADLDIDSTDILQAVEAVILARDPGAVACRGRAYPASDFHHTHVTLRVTFLPKAHRDAEFMNAMHAEIEAVLKARIHQPCGLAVGLTFTGDYYKTTKHDGAPR